jgi:quercetin dioxygenase-like cupin family protein
MWKRSLILNLLLSSLWNASGASLAADFPHPTRLGPRSHVAFSQALPPMDGNRLQVTTVEVTYPPGGSSAPHSHPCPVVGYVIEGAVRMRVKGGPESVYKTGDSFYEAPNGIHLVSANASLEKPATFLAYFICDHSVPLSVAVPTNKSGGGDQP